MSLVINKQAIFVVRMAKNLQLCTATQRKEVLAQMDPKVTRLVNTALRVMSEKKRGKG